MAYAAVASLLQTIDLLLDHHQHSISPQFRDQIVSIHENTRSLRSFIEGSSDRVNNWEETIRQVSCKAEDIIELLLSDSLLKPTAGGSSESELEKGKYEVRYSFDELEKVRQEIETIAARVKGRRVEIADDSDGELMEMISLLRGGSAALEIIAICGSGGMGKTTLAGKACNHPMIVEHFDVRAGAVVTGEYTWRNMIVNLLISLKLEVIRSSSEDELIERLLKILGRKRYLIVLDDVWSFEVLERIRMILPDCGNGSRIIFTTRSSELAKSAHHIHEMLVLDEEESWNMLREKIFEGDPCPFQLESMGKMIARSCGGHLLSNAVVSGILASDQTEAAWDDVLENIKIASKEEGDKLYEMLYLSYIYLPRHLRPCFLYLGIFPEEYQIYVSALIRLWVAEGFVNQSESKSLEETGEQYVEDLVTRSLVSVYTRKSNGGIKSIGVHDLIRGMCLRQARRDSFYLHLDRYYRHTPRLEMEEFIKSCRRLSNSIQCDDLFSGVRGSTIRTLYLSLEYGKLDLRCWMENVRLLRILDLLKVKSYHLPGEVFELIHLRYLAMYLEFNIPNAISNLVNLQTLIMQHIRIGGVFDKLPNGIWRMPRLRHLRIFSFKFPNKRGPASSLDNLQTLSQVVDFECSREILKMFPNVRKLVLLYTNSLKDIVEDYELHNLIYLRKLEVLKLQANLASRGEYKMSFAFPQTLKRLSLRALKLPWEAM